MMLIETRISEFSITLNPAEAVSMGGMIGSIEVRKRAGLAIVLERMELPVVTRTIVGGEVVCAAGREGAV